MKEKPVRPLATQIQKRFFLALNELINQGRISGLGAFTESYGLHNPKYCELRAFAMDPAKKTKFKFIDIDAPGYLIRDYGVSGEWLFTGKGQMFRSEVKKSLSVLF